MDIHNLSTIEIGKLAKKLVAEKLVEFGFSVEMPKGNKNVVIAKSSKDNKEIFFRVKSRRSGDWQIPITEGRSNSERVDNNEYWVLVDFKEYPGFLRYFILPGTWLRRNIFEDHQSYLRSHGGIRPVSPKSTHHKVRLESIEHWKDRWDILS